MPKLNNETIELICIAVTALAVLLQGIVLLFIYLALRKAISSLHEEVEDLRASIMPTIDDARDLIGNTRTLIDNTRRLFARMAPKAEATVGDLAKMAHGLQEQTVELESAVQEVLGRVRFQAGRIDAMTTNGLGKLPDWWQRPKRSSNRCAPRLSLAREGSPATRTASFSKRTHPSRKNKDKSRMGHPASLLVAGNSPSRRLVLAPDLHREHSCRSELFFVRDTGIFSAAVPVARTTVTSGLRQFKAFSSDKLHKRTKVVNIDHRRPPQACKITKTVRRQDSASPILREPTPATDSTDCEDAF